jgi:uncharacterized protein YceH (UPF0502 family)
MTTPSLPTPLWGIWNETHPGWVTHGNIIAWESQAEAAQALELVSSVAPKGWVLSIQELELRNGTLHLLSSVDRVSQELNDLKQRVTTVVTSLDSEVEKLASMVAELQLRLDKLTAGGPSL